MSLALRDVVYSYGPKLPVVLDGVDLAIESGESVAIMAPSGEGKSTLLAIAGLMLKPQRGVVEIDGVARTPVPDTTYADEVTWLFQTTSVLMRRSALDNVALPLLAKGSSRAHAHREAERCLDAVGISQFGHEDVRRLSGGQVQRVGIARALATRPKVVVADEPTANLDFDTGRAVMHALLGTLNHASVLVATHDARIAAMTSRTQLLEHGKIS